LDGPRILGAGGQRKDIVVYRQGAEQRVVFSTAAKAWARGVPWEDALRIAKDVSKKTKAGKGKAGGKG